MNENGTVLPGDALSRLLALHKPYSIYEECDHDHSDDAEGENGVVYVPEIGATCKKAYDICAECCTDGAGEQSEECASEHKHGEGIAICGTALILSHETFQSEGEPYVCRQCRARYTAGSLAFCPDHGLCKVNCCTHSLKPTVQAQDDISGAKKLAEHFREIVSAGHKLHRADVLIGFHTEDGLRELCMDNLIEAAEILERVAK